MAYCSSCGAYLPDGETVCLACGADSSAPKNSNTQFTGGTAAAYAENGRKASGAPDSDDLRRQLEEKQRQQKEKNAEWARQACSEHKKENTHRPSASGGATGAHRASVHPDSTGTPHTAGSTRQKNPEESRRIFGKVLAFLSYVSFFCILPFILTPEDSFAKFHARQGILLFLVSLVLNLLSVISFPLIGVISLARIYLMIRGIINVLKDRKEPLPLIGKYAEQFLKF